MSRAPFLTLSLVVLALLGSGVASADVEDSTKAKQASAEAKELYQNSQQVSDESAKQALYKAAHDKFREAYRLDPKPDYLFNIAQTARFQGDCETALGAYTQVAQFLSDLEDTNTQVMRITGEWIDLLSSKCVASREFAPADPVISPENITPPSEEKGAPKGAMLTGPIDTSSKTKSRRPIYIGAAIGAATVGAILGGYALYNFNRTRPGGFYDEEFAAAVAAMPPDMPNPDDPCASSGLSLAAQTACDDGDTAAQRATISGIAAGAFGVAALTFGYLAFTQSTSTQSSEERSSGQANDTKIGVGPGDVGVMVQTSF